MSSSNASKPPHRHATSAWAWEMSKALMKECQRVLEPNRQYTCDKAREFIKAGANVNHRGYMNRTPLMWGAMKRDTEFVMMLLDAGADVNIQDDDGLTALHYAILWGKTDNAKMLLHHGARLDLLDNDHKTALDTAIEKNNRDIIHAIQQTPQRRKKEFQKKLQQSHALNKNVKKPTRAQFKKRPKI